MKKALFSVALPRMAASMGCASLRMQTRSKKAAWTLLFCVALVFIGCASTSGGGTPGTLTITGIPAEYEHMVVGFRGTVAISSNAGKLFCMSENPRRSWSEAVTNGKTSMQLYETHVTFGSETALRGYTGSDTININFNIINLEGNTWYSVVGGTFRSVKFEKGVAAVKWDDAVSRVAYKPPESPAAPAPAVAAAPTKPTAAAPVAVPAAPTVIFDSQGGSAVAAQTIKDGGTVAYPAEPVKDWAFFGGWYKEAGAANPCDYRAPVTGPLTLYAKWLTESDMIAADLGASVPAGNVFEVNNNSAAAEGQPGWNNSWAKARAAINAGGAGKNYVIKVTGNFQLAAVESSTFTPRTLKVLVYAPANKTISSSGGYGSLLYAGATQTLILRNITLQGPTVSAANATLVMRPGMVSGRVSVSGGTFTMSGGTISGNKGSTDGGGVSVGSGTFMMSGGTINGNTISNNENGGGGVYVGSGTFTMSGGTISGNTASGGNGHGARGGGVYVAGGTFTMGGGTISGNTASQGGGGVYVRGGIFTMGGGTINGHSISSSNGASGSGVYVAGGIFTMSGGIISDNKVSYGSGGGVRVEGGTFAMSGGIISGNQTYWGNGGGVYVNRGGTFTMDGGTIGDNQADPLIVRSDASGGGGGVYVAGGTFTIRGGSISGNSAGGGNGGGVDVVGGTFTMGGGTISGNETKGNRGGGGVHVDAGTFWLRGGTIHGRGAGLANTGSPGASLSIKDTAAIAKYGSGADILENTLATDETLAGHD